MAAFPPLPSSWTTWDLRASTAGFFLGNTSGQNDAAESARETSLGVVGLGWQLGLRDGAAWAVNGGLESRQREAARLLKVSGSAVKVMVSAELDCTSPQWEASAAAIRNRSLARRVFMHHPNGSLWLDHKWGGLFTHRSRGTTGPAPPLCGGGSTKDPSLKLCATRTSTAST